MQMIPLKGLYRCTCPGTGEGCVLSARQGVLPGTEYQGLALSNSLEDSMSEVLLSISSKCQDRVLVSAVDFHERSMVAKPKRRGAVPVLKGGGLAP